MKPAILAALVAALLIAAPARGDEAVVATVKTLTGSAVVTRAGVQQPLQPGAALYEKDEIRTAANSSVGITFRDDTRIALGPDSRIEALRFVFRPATREYGLVLRLLTGTLEYISGLTAKLSPESVSIETPTATIAVRGTRFLARASS